MNMVINKKTGSMMLGVFMAMLMMSQPAAAAGLSDINSFLGEIQGALKGVGVAVVIIAFMVAGYKIIFGGSTVREVAPIAIGGLVIGAAPYLASLIIK